LPPVEVNNLLANTNKQLIAVRAFDVMRLPHIS
jgi:hypothetical protein